MYNVNLLYFLIFSLIIIFNFKFSLFVCRRYSFYDFPNERKIHKDPVLISGGIFLYLNTLVFLIISLVYFKDFISIPLRDAACLFAGITVVFFVGFIDDISNLKIFFRYSIIFVFLCLILNFTNIFLIKDVLIKLNNNSYNFIIENKVIFSSIIIVLFLIMYNLLDGINLFSSLLTILYLIYFQMYHSNYFLLIFNILISCSLLFFLYFNFKNLSFLGNGGVNILSFVIVFELMFLNNQQNLKFQFDLFVALLAFIIPILDMSRLFIVRLIKTGNPFIPDNNHLHHLLLKKFNILFSNIILLIIIFSPLFINFYLLNSFTIEFIIYQVILYSVLILLLKKS